MLYYILYYGTYVILIPGFLLALIAQIAIDVNYSRYSKRKSKSQWTADEMSMFFSEKYGMYGLSVRPIKGKLTDNYNPSTDVLSLSQGVYGNTSIAALGIAAHECGHAMQNHEESFLLKLRTFLVPVTNIGSRLAIPVAVLGILLEWVIGGSGNNIGSFVLCLGILLYSLTALFALITLPVEIDASRRGMKMLREQAILDKKEMIGARRILISAALTYVASLVMSVLYLLRFIVILSSFRRRNDN